MQSADFSLSSPSSIPSLNPQKFGFNPRFDPIRVSYSLSASKRHDLSGSSNVVSVPSLPKLSWSLSSSSALPLRAWNSVPSDSKADRFEVRATAVESAGEGEKSGSLTKMLELGLLFGLWYLFNIYFNIYNKQVPLSFFKSLVSRFLFFRFHVLFNFLLVVLVVFNLESAN